MGVSSLRVAVLDTLLIGAVLEKVLSMGLLLLGTLLLGTLLLGLKTRDCLGAEDLGYLSVASSELSSIIDILDGWGGAVLEGV